MRELNEKFLDLPKEELEWFLAFETILKKDPEIIEMVERKAFKKGYMDLVMLLDSMEVSEIFKEI